MERFHVTVTADLVVPDTAHEPAYRGLVVPETWERVTYSIGKSTYVQDLADRLELVRADLAGRIFGQTLWYLICCGRKRPTEPFYASSETLDEGWHAFFLQWPEYSEFGETHCQPGGFIPHRPFHPVLDDCSVLAPARDRAKAAMVRHGFDVDELVWQGKWSDCGACPF